jgi:hypothetical protein
MIVLQNTKMIYCTKIDGCLDSGNRRKRIHVRNIKNRGKKNDQTTETPVLSTPSLLEMRAPDAGGSIRVSSAL